MSCASNPISTSGWPQEPRVREPVQAQGTGPPNVWCLFFNTLLYLVWALSDLVDGSVKMHRAACRARYGRGRSKARPQAGIKPVVNHVVHRPAGDEPPRRPTSVSARVPVVCVCVSKCLRVLKCVLTCVCVCVCSCVCLCVYVLTCVCVCVLACVCVCVCESGQWVTWGKRPHEHGEKSTCQHGWVKSFG